jgi:peptidyl-tRNA hydrolase, PTH1 family
VNGTLIVGLGNPGREYQRTRHNVGFMAADALAARWGMTFARQRARAEVAEGSALGRWVSIAKPQTFMNNSGDAVRTVMRLANLTPSDVIVVYDEMDLPFGRLRLRERGSAGGHRGLQSIIDQLGTNEFARLRIGVSRPPTGLDPIDYVLTTFSAAELADLKDIFDRVAEGVEVFMRDGVTAAMNVVNVAPKAAIAATSPESEAIR